MCHMKCHPIRGVVFEENEQYLKVKVSGHLTQQLIVELFTLIGELYSGKNILFCLSYGAHIDLSRKGVKSLVDQSKETIEFLNRLNRVSIHTAKLSDHLLAQYAASLCGEMLRDKVKLSMDYGNAQKWVNA